MRRLIAAAALLASQGAFAQQPPSGQTVPSSAGQAAQRQAHPPDTTPEPMGRIANRIQNRVQSRIRTRVERNQDPGAAPASPFEVAEDQVRTPGRRRR